MIRILCTFVIVSVCVAASGADNWTRFRGPNGSGIATNQDIPVKFDDKDGIAWKVRIPGLGHSAPVVWGEQLFLQTSSEDGKERSLLCLDVKTGKQLWSRSIPAKRAPTHQKSSMASATPATDGEAVYVPFWDGQDVLMSAYSLKGDLLWSKNLGIFVSQHGAGASPIVYKDKVILANDMDLNDSRGKVKPVPKPAVVYAFDKKTGNIVYELPREAYRACYSPPYFWERPGMAPEMIVTSTTAITSYNPDTGAENWHWKWTFPRGKLRTIASSYICDDMLFASSGDGGGDRMMYAVRLESNGKSIVAKNAWNNEKDFPYVPGALVSGSHVFFANDRGYAGCFEMKTGKKIWLERLPEATFSSSPVLIDGKVYAPSEQGDVFVFAAEPTSFQLLARNSLGEMVRASSAVADGRFFVRGQNHLFCISKKK